MTRENPRTLTVKLNPHEFRKRLLVDCCGVPRYLDEVADDWQRQDFGALDGGWQLAAGVPVTCRPLYQRAYLERPRGHSKTTDLSAMAAWILYAAPSLRRGVVAAADVDQARIDVEAIATLCRLNPMLRRVLEVQRNRVTNRETGSELSVISSDADSSYGLLLDFILCDELVHWQDGKGEQLFYSLHSTAAKKATCFMGIISNAGRGTDSSCWWTIREQARQDANFYFSRLDGPVASWMSQDKIDEQRRFMPPIVFNRLIMNQWTTNSGDALSQQAIDNATTLQGPMRGRPASPLADDWAFVAGLDLAVVGDHAALVVLGIERGKNQIILASCEAWAPPRGGQIDLAVVERAIVEAHRKFRLSKLVYDPYQAIATVQSLKRRHIHCEPMNFVGRNLDLMASTLLDVFNSEVIQLYDDSLLRRDLGRLTLTEKSYGWKLESARDATGHADRAIALAICLPAALTLCHYRAFGERRPPQMLSHVAPPRESVRVNHGNGGLPFDRHGNNRQTILQSGWYRN